MQQGGRRSAPSLIASPVFVGAVVLLALNDHVGKQAWPGIVTGKLSDVAGVVMVAVGLTALLRRPGPAFTVTAVGFAVLKTVPSVAMSAAPVLGGVTRTDPTDLVALLALAPTWWWVHRRPDRVGTTREVRPAAWLLPLQIAAIGSAVVVTSATSCAPDGVDRVAFVDGAVYARASDGTYRSDDGGRTWATAEGSWSGLVEDDGPGSLAEDRTESCAGGICVRIESSDGALTMVETSDGSSQSSLILSAAELDRIDRHIADGCTIGDPFESVTAFEYDGRVEVVLSAAHSGVLHRDATGEWSFVAVGEWGLPFAAIDDLPESVGVTSVGPAEPFPWGRWVARAIPVAELIGFLWAAGALVARAERNDRRPAVAKGVAAAVGAMFALPLIGVVWLDILAGDGSQILAPDRSGMAALYLALAIPGAIGFAVTLAILAGLTGPRTEVPLPPPSGPRVG